MSDALELLELAQHSPVLVRDGRTGGQAQNWITDGLHRRQVIDDAEIQTLQSLFGLSSSYPTNPLTVVSYTILQRIPLAT